MRIPYPGFLILLLASAPISRGAAQAPRTAARIRGQVTDSLGVPISLASVRLVGTPYTTTTDSLGLFRFTNLPPNTYSVLVRQIGWKLQFFQLTLQAGESWVGRIGLEPAPIRLPDINVIVTAFRYGKPPKYWNTTRFDDFYMRRAFGLGSYMTRDQVDAAIASGAYRLTSMLQRMHMPGVHVYNYDSHDYIAFGRCPEGVIGVWIDGAKVPFKTTDIEGLIDVQSIEAIEVYRGVAEIPGEFLEDNCAAIVIWTRYN